jgi:hypothetical protein
MHFLTSLTLLAILSLSTTVLSHPGHDIRQEALERAAFLKTNKRDLSHCSAKMKARGINQASIQRRAAVAKEARKKRGLALVPRALEARNATSVLNTTHLSPSNYSISTDESTLFAGNNSCVLSPEVTEGPYCGFLLTISCHGWMLIRVDVNGEYVRENVTEDQAGVELILDTQIIDMATCDPVADVMLEIWRAYF